MISNEEECPPASRHSPAPQIGLPRLNGVARFRRSVTVGAYLSLTSFAHGDQGFESAFLQRRVRANSTSGATTRRTTANVTGTARVDVFAIKMQKIEASKANRSVARSPASPYAARAPASFSSAVVVDNMEAAVD